MHLASSSNELIKVSKKAYIDGHFDVYDLTTNHESHNYVVGGIVCHNKKLEH